MWIGHQCFCFAFWFIWMFTWDLKYLHVCLNRIISAPLWNRSHRLKVHVFIVEKLWLFWVLGLTSLGKTSNHNETFTYTVDSPVCWTKLHIFFSEKLKVVEVTLRLSLMQQKQIFDEITNQRTDRLPVLSHSFTGHWSRFHFLISSHYLRAAVSSTHLSAAQLCHPPPTSFIFSSSAFPPHLPPNRSVSQSDSQEMNRNATTQLSEIMWLYLSFFLFSFILSFPYCFFFFFRRQKRGGFRQQG